MKILACIRRTCPCLRQWGPRTLRSVGCSSYLGYCGLGPAYHGSGPCCINDRCGAAWHGLPPNNLCCSQDGYCVPLELVTTWKRSNVAISASFKRLFLICTYLILVDVVNTCEMTTGKSAKSRTLCNIL
jgi:hypothetical protein